MKTFPVKSVGGEMCVGVPPKGTREKEILCNMKVVGEIQGGNDEE